MKKFLLFVSIAAMSVACSSSSKNTTTTVDGRTITTTASAKNAKNAKYQIIDQEFDNLLAPDADYETLHDYELQACGDSYLPPADPALKTVKPGKKDGLAVGAAAAVDTNVKKSKKVTNTTNIYYIDGPMPMPNQITNSTTTTTTYSNSGGSSTYRSTKTY